MKSLYSEAPDIQPQRMHAGMSVPELMDMIGKTSFEARNLYRGAELLRKMIDGGDTVWLGIAGAGIAGGMGGQVITLIEAGYVDVICSTGAQVYHDLHFAFDLPVKAIGGRHFDDNLLRKHGDTRIYDIGIREKETLEAQDTILQQFVVNEYEELKERELSSWEFTYLLGNWVERNAPFPDRSFVAAAAKLGVPVFWDSLANHSIAMNLVKTDNDGYPVRLSAQRDIFHSAAIVYCSPASGFFLLGGGGPKNFIQQTGPTLHQILSVDYEGADRGVQIGTAVEREGSLSSCTFSEAVTWGKYSEVSDETLVHIWAEYSLVVPLLTAYLCDVCMDRKPKKIAGLMPHHVKLLEDLL
ncbi:deoxyhypusine synthase family protein [bacterium]|nr:deoxyhypusine synthase family protein [bacterium]